MTVGNAITRTFEPAEYKGLFSEKDGVEVSASQSKFTVEGEKIKSCV
jgi:hypothetical protein